MARRDVDLVIRARDEAKNTLDAITAAVDKFTGAQNKMQGEAEQSGGALADLGASLVTLRKNFAGLTGQGQIAQGLARTRVAMSALAKSTEQAAGEAIGYEKEARAAARATEELRAKANAVEAELTKQLVALKASETAQRNLTKATDQATTAQAKYADRQLTLQRQISEQSERVRKLQTTYASLRDEIAGASTVSEKLNARFNASSAALQKAQNALASYKETQSLIAAENDRASNSIQRANNRYGFQAAAVTRTAEAISRLKVEQQASLAAVDASAKEQVRLERAATRAAAAFEKQAQTLSQSQTDFDRYEAALKGSEEAMASLDATTRRTLLKNLREQITRLRETEQAFDKSRTAATRLGQEYARTEAPTRGLQSAFDTATAAARRGREELAEQRATLQQLRGILSETGGGLDAFASRQERFAAALSRSRNSFAQYSASARSAEQATARLAREQAVAATRAEQQERATLGLGAAHRRGARDAGIFANAIRRSYGESRQALSFTQRLRGEILALAAAYGGFFAAIQGVTNVVDSFQQVEIAANRLSVVFEGNEAAIASELDFIRRSADRLGIQFGVLANEYTKFAIATQGTNLAGENTRKIFNSIAESARVNGASIEQLQGTFVAVTQIVSKASFSMEELRQQLGDRLPGAVKILADALDIPVADLIDDIENGRVSADRLLEFAEELDRRFGVGLPAALEKTTASIGKFQNALFKAFVAVGEGGLIDGFNELLRDLTEVLASGEAEAALQKIGAAAGSLFEILGTLAQNFDLVIVAITTFLGLKIAPFVVALVTTLGRMPAILRLISIRTVGARAALTSLGAAAGTAATGFTAARVALTGLLSSTGIGLAVVAVGAAIGVWATQTDAATEVLRVHRTLMDRVRNAYDKTGASAKAWREEVERISKTDAQSSLNDLRRQLEASKDAFESLIPREVFSGNALDAGGGFFQEVDTLFSSFNDGNIGIDAFIAQLDELSQKYRALFPVNDRFAREFSEGAKSILDLTKRTAEANDILIALTGSEEEASAALKRLSGVVEAVSDATEDNAKRTAEFEGALDQIAAKVPSLADDLDRLSESAKLNEAVDAALALAEGYEEVNRVFQLYKKAQNDFDIADTFEGVGGDGRRASAALIRRLEGFREEAYPDFTIRGGQRVNSGFRAGFGSGTVTLADGSIQRVVEGMRVTLGEANRDLARRISEGEKAIAKDIGEERFAGFAAEQQAVLQSIRFNYGSLPDRIIDELRNGTVTEIGQAIRDLGGDNGGINRDRRDFEAATFESGGAISDEGFFEAEAERLKQIEKITEEKKKQQLATDQLLANQQFEIAQQELINIGKEREAAIQAALRDAKQQDTEISKEELALIEERAGKLFDLVNAERLANAEREKAEKAEGRVNELLTLRSQLQQQIAAILESGVDTGAVDQIREGLVGVNEELQIAIQAALDLFNALGSSDPAVAAVVSRLETLAVTSRTSANQVTVSWSQVGQTFASTLTKSVVGFFENVAEGKNIIDSAKDAFLSFASDFLRQIAQMIIQQIALNTAKAIGRAFGVPIFHQGGIVGSTGAARRVNPAVFASAQRFHEGGLPGLARNEVPAILEKGEEVLTEADPRHRFNLGSAAPSNENRDRTPRIVNAIDSASFVEEALRDTRGEEVFLNFISANRAAIQSALGQ